jgi:cell division protein FtsQ
MTAEQGYDALYTGETEWPGEQDSLRPHRLGPWGRRLVVAAVILVILGGGWLWLRGSSLVAIRSVQVSGLSGPAVPEIRAALTSSAESMTTLNLSVPALRKAVADYPYVRSLKVSRHWPHGLTISVDEQVPTALAVGGGRSAVVDADGRFLWDVGTAKVALPEVVLGSAPTGQLLTDTHAIAAVKLLDAAPYALLAHVKSVGWTADHGLVAQLRNGPALYFGTAVAPASEWQAAVAVLANSSSKGASYIDVSNPERVAAGG